VPEAAGRALAWALGCLGAWVLGIVSSDGVVLAVGLAAVGLAAVAVGALVPPTPPRALGVTS